MRPVHDLEDEFAQVDFAENNVIWTWVDDGNGGFKYDSVHLNTAVAGE